ncbi:MULTISPECIES: cellulose biosynthesis protein BcsP [Cupriavidus]
MSQSDDLSKLFQRFGGKAEAYQEIVRDDAAAQARERWPLLSSVRVDRAATVPPVQPAGAPPQAGGPAVSPWRGLGGERTALAGEPPAAAGKVMQAAPEPAPPAPGAAMEPRFRTPGGAPPARVAEAPPRAPAWEPLAPPPAPPAMPAAAPPAFSTAPPPSVSAAAPVSFAPPAPFPAAPAAPDAAGTELARVFARLEGRPEPAPASERAPARRSFLDRLKRP